MPGNPTQTDAAATRREQLLARIEELLAQSWPIDYERPFVGHSEERPELFALYLEACRAGDTPSCWIAAEMDGWNPGAAFSLLIENCRAGDFMSCRALPSSWIFGEDLPGHQGRLRGCHEPGTGYDCDVKALRAECQAGFALSCSACGERSTREMSDREEMSARTAALARDGCLVGIRQECGLILDDLSEGARRLLAERMCPLKVSWCGGLSSILLRAGAIERARDLAERTCQYGGEGNSHECLELAAAYADGTFAEPVPGRGEALAAWVCARPRMQRSARCKERAVKQAEPAPRPR